MAEKRIDRMKDEGKRTKERMPELEILRCLAMMMVVVLHFLDKGGYLGAMSEASMPGSRTLAWFLESFAICAVNLYMLLSGYLLCETHFKITRLLQLVLQVWMYSVGIGLLSVVLGLYPISEVNLYFLLRLFFPISQSHYWFLTAYTFFYLLVPFLGIAVQRLSAKALRLMIALFLLVFSVLKSIAPFQFDTDQKGYDCLWYICLFLTAVYIRKYGILWLRNARQGLCVYLISCLAIFGVSMGIRAVYLQTGHLERNLTVCYHYNHFLVFLAAVGLFTAFLGFGGKTGLPGRICGRIGRYTLGVYLLHENLGIRTLWPGWFGAQQTDTAGALLVHLLTAVMIVFAAGIFTEFVRSSAVKGLHTGMMHLKPYRMLIQKLEAWDDLFEMRNENELKSKQQ
ncbi:MAG: acyltransferase [Lachnospiraceae bacterium]|nr:acyltransferase [Lachnospiraceae bacterium]